MVTVVKIGGSTFGAQDTTIADIVALQRKDVSLVIVHGGGSLVSEWLSREGTATRFVRGERVTDRATLDVATAVLAGLANKELVAAVNNAGGRAVGISGVDGALVRAQVKNEEIGYVGAVDKIDAALLETLLGDGFIPFVSPISLNATGDTSVPQMLNVNGDVIAGEIAAAIGADKLIFLTDVPGIRDESGKLLPDLAAGEVGALVDSGVASGGMIPKINACLRALGGGTTITRIIDGRQPHALLSELEGHGAGTTIHE